MSVAAARASTALEERIGSYIEGKDASIGVAVIIDGTDTTALNNDCCYPMMSVFKFPLALAVAGYCENNGMEFTDSVDIAADEIKTGTWSPMRERYSVADLRLPLSELLAYSLQQSDNNACDIQLRLIGGPAVVDSLMKTGGYQSINISVTEDDMHRDPSLASLNCATPLEMARLFDRFAADMRTLSPRHQAIASLIEDCHTGTDRLPRPLDGTGAIIGHKTGTGDRLSDGRISAINDCGYVIMPDGRRYSIAVFIAGSGYSQADTAAIIADISGIVFDYVNGRP